MKNKNYYLASLLKDADEKGLKVKPRDANKKLNAALIELDENREFCSLVPWVAKKDAPNKYWLSAKRGDLLLSIEGVDQENGGNIFWGINLGSILRKDKLPLC